MECFTKYRSTLEMCLLQCGQVQLELVRKCSKERQQLFHQWRQEHEYQRGGRGATDRILHVCNTSAAQESHSRCCLRTNLLRGKSRARVTARPYTRERFQAPLRKGFPGFQIYKTQKRSAFPHFLPTEMKRVQQNTKNPCARPEGFILRIQILCPEYAHPIV